MRWTSRSAWRRSVAVLCGASLCVVAAGVATAGLGAATSPVNTFRVSGAGSGTLDAGPYSGCLNTLVKTNGLTAVNDLVGSISGFTKGVANWSLDVTEKKTGTFTITGSLLVDPTVEFSASPKGLDFAAVLNDRFWAKSGTLTIAAETGSIDATFASTAGQTLKISGAWKCKT